MIWVCITNSHRQISEWLKKGCPVSRSYKGEIKEVPRPCPVAHQSRPGARKMFDLQAQLSVLKEDV